ncbi:Galactose/methyl galactoside import ATP-binding protein MglA [bioreactor metagenome]|uniref:Galactose/methyl galactoside import ATP-binding protein MglA n=1 Tax=bioreactor metagenome TaxID=1076179 RepID=A0A645AM10_9ZZZZ
MRILYGLYQADSGDILVNENKVRIASPSDAILNGIGMVTQHFTLVPTLTVTENILLSEKKGVFLNVEKNQKFIIETSEKFGLPIRPQMLVKHLSVGEKQRVEIFKALFRNANVLILDEPTAVLIPQEIDQLMETLQKLKQQDFSVIFISHKLNEVMAICDRISVLRDGNMIGTVNKSDITQKDLACMMVGRETFGVKKDSEEIKSPSAVLKVENLCANDKKGLPALKDVSFEIHKGQILGLAGVSGNGQSELSQVLCGILKAKSGSITFEDKDLTHASPAEVVAAGVGRIPEERNTSVVGEMTVAENLVMEHMSEFTRKGMLNQEAIQDYAKKMIADFNIKAKPGDKIRTLSGGNMQKALLARVLSRDPHAIIVSQPTRGLDVGATEYIRQKLIEQARKGAAILLISEDLDEILALSDQIAIIYEGQIMDILPCKDAKIEHIGLLMAGSKPA